jgi:hypothetical protein
MHHAPVLQSDQAPRKGGNVVLMRDEHNCNALLLIELLENAHDLAAGLRVEIASGFVSQYQLGIIHQGPADRDALLLPAG